MKIISSFCLITMTATLQAEVPKATPLLDEIISHPGSYSQVCDMMTAPDDIPYRALELTDFAGAGFSEANLAIIAKSRDTLVKAIRTRLLEIDFSREAQQPAEDLSVKESPSDEIIGTSDNFGCDPKSLNPLLLDLIKQLHATEALPELLEVEAKLVKGIAKAKGNAKAPAPIVDGWFVGVMGPFENNPDESDRDRKINLFHARVAQRDLVMLMALLLRQKTYAPYLKTSLEAAYAAGLKENATSYPSYKTGDPIPEGKYGRNYEVDPVTHLLRRERDFVSIPYTRESRDEVRAAAAKWIAEHP